MFGVLTAPSAVFGQFEPLARVRLVLGCHVVPALALFTSQGYGRSFIGRHFYARFARLVGVSREA